TLVYLHQHSLFNTHPLFGCFIVYIHETSLSFTDKYNYSCEFSFFSFNLAVGSNADFHFISCFTFTFQYISYFICDRNFDPFATQFPPSLLFHFIPSFLIFQFSISSLRLNPIASALSVLYSFSPGFVISAIVVGFVIKLLKPRRSLSRCAFLTLSFPNSYFAINLPLRINAESTNVSELLNVQIN